MVLTITLSPRVERKIVLSGFCVGGENQIIDAKETVSGRGVRAGMALKELGDKVLCMGFCSEEGERIIAQALASEEILCDFIKIPGALRMRFTLYDTSENKVTRCTRQGTAVDSKAIEQLEVAFARNLLEMGEGDVVVLGGDTPPEMDTAVYAGLVGMAKDRNVRTVLAAHDALLEKGLPAGPYAAIASLHDLEHLVGKQMAADKRICTEAREILQQWGMKYLCIDAGKKMLMVSGQEAYLAQCQDKRGMAEARDGAAAGLAHGVQLTAEAEQLLRYAAAGKEALCAEAAIGLEEFEAKARQISPVQII